MRATRGRVEIFRGSRFRNSPHPNPLPKGEGDLESAICKSLAATTMHRILQLLSIDNDPGAGPLARLDVRVKLIVAIAAITASLLSTRAALPLAALGVSLGLLAVFARAVANRAPPPDRPAWDSC